MSSYNYFNSEIYFHFFLLFSRDFRLSIKQSILEKMHITTSPAAICIFFYIKYPKNELISKTKNTPVISLTSIAKSCIPAKMSSAAILPRVSLPKICAEATASAAPGFLNELINSEQKFFRCSPFGRVFAARFGEILINFSAGFL